MSIPDVRLGNATPALPSHSPVPTAPRATLSASFSERLAATAPAPQTAPAAATQPTSSVHPAIATTPDVGTAAQMLVNRVARGERFVERVVRGAASGAAYSPQDLLVIQSQVYRHTQEVELLSKFVDRATNTVKTILQQGN
ncbi:MAG: hypothetical protein Q8Q09_23470 [Deltaproteobacteria bacterium]|nr:hypothetical protein [Deltaproteobacteria bacterium]